MIEGAIPRKRNSPLEHNPFIILCRDGLKAAMRAEYCVLHSQVAFVIQDATCAASVVGLLAVLERFVRELWGSLSLLAFCFFGLRLESKPRAAACNSSYYQPSPNYTFK